MSSEEEDTSLQQDEETSSEWGFVHKYKIAEETAISLKKEYVLSLCQDAAFTRVVAGLTDGRAQVFDVSGQGFMNLETVGIASAEGSTCGVRFLDETANSLLVGKTTGQVYLYDLRCSKKLQVCFEDSMNAHKSITCFDSNANGRILCTGGDKYKEDVFLLFYDVRQRKHLGAYVESHHDDVTALCFHAVIPDRLCSGSTDGLINIFDTSAPNEDDGLITTINTESSVHKMSWHSSLAGKDYITCITHTNDFMAYESEGDLVASFERTEITEALGRKNPANCNLIGAHSMENDGGVFLLGGTIFNKGDKLRSLRQQNGKLAPLGDYCGNKQIIRTSMYDCSKRLLVTAGECGIVSLWSPSNETKPESMSHQLKAKTKSNSRKNTPY